MDRHQPQGAAVPPGVDHTDPSEIESDDPNAPTATDILDEYLDDVVDVSGGAPDATQALEMRPYYLGTVILAPHVATGSSQGARVAIYDGLQRFTVLTILAAVLRDTTTSLVLKERLDDLINQHGTHRLEQVGSDAVLTDIIQTPGGTLDARDLRGRGQYSDTSKLLIRVKNKLLGVVETWDEGYRARFTDYLLEHVIIGAIRIEDDALARQMFVATNLYGRRLDPVDVLKGQLADALGASEDTHADAFIAHWTRFRQQFGDGFIEFIRVVAAIERKQRQGPTWATDFGTYVAETYGGENADRFLGRFQAYAYGWEELLEITTNARLFRRPTTEIEQHIYRLSVFWWPEWHPIALLWWNQVRKARRDGTYNGSFKRRMISNFRRLHRRCMGFVLAGVDDALRADIFANALADIARNRDPFRHALEIKPKQKIKIDRTLRSQIRSEEIWQPLTRWLEMAHWRKGLPTLISRGNTEHVLAQRPELPSTTLYPEHDRLCYALGNLTFIDAKVNDKLSNSKPEDKLPAIRLEAERYTLAHSVGFDEDGRPRERWNVDEIEARTAYLRSYTWELLAIDPPK